MVQVARSSSAMADDVVELLRAQIIDHRVAPGERLNIDAISRELQVSPTPVREALARLEVEGLTTKRPLAGYRAADILSGQELDELFELRLRIEPWLAERAAGAQGLTRAQLRPLRTIDPLAPHDEATFQRQMHADTRLHDTVAELAGNELARQVLTQLHGHYHTYRLKPPQTASDAAEAEHAALVAAIIDGNPRQAREAMRTHLHRAHQRLRAHLRRIEAGEQSS
jgi:DNA-binding GntR family transcriptional regulator